MAISAGQEEVRQDRGCGDYEGDVEVGGARTQYVE